MPSNDTRPGLLALVSGAVLSQSHSPLPLQLGHPCTDVFPGLAPHSEPEVASIVEYFTSLKPVLGAIDMHSFQQFVLYPFGMRTITVTRNIYVCVTVFVVCSNTYICITVHYMYNAWVCILITTCVCACMYHASRTLHHTQTSIHVLYTLVCVHSYFTLHMNKRRHSYKHALSLIVHCTYVSAQPTQLRSLLIIAKSAMWPSKWQERWARWASPHTGPLPSVTCLDIPLCVTL